ncbi:YfbU family protein [Acidovorax sp. NCPPB 3576]|uniref:YfbU family protein n=1 Tax=Acidovorax sp. NCPPB 3576 TaxID=2940488 RepID=UPI002349A922|nr:YfbU family protein [Acidovorax sp. NCPPB 3576]WCM86542.1 YfbU family protein [Acidovorax sp. NCPPB 3576]
MQLTKKERVFLANQYKILAALDPDSAGHYEELIEIVERGYEIFYSAIDEWFSEEMTETDGKFVLEILDLYRAIEDVKRKTKNAELLSHPFAIFRGFDGNIETNEMAFCRFLIGRQGKFEEQKQYISHNDNLNSHAPMSWKYHAMLNEANKLIDIWQMDAKDAIKILNAERLV